MTDNEKTMLIRSLKLAYKRATLIQGTTEGSGVTEMFLVKDILECFRILNVQPS